MTATGGPRRLAPQVARAWRGPGTVQFGSDPSRAVLVSGLDADDRRVLDLLDRGVSLAALESDARRRGTDTARPRALVTLLDQQRLLVAPDRTGDPARARSRAEDWCWDAAVPGSGTSRTAGRAASAVGVHGTTGLVAAVAAGFAAAGVGTVATLSTARVDAVDVLPGGPTGTDVGRPMTAAARSAVARVAPDTRTEPRALDLAVLVGRHAHDAGQAAAWLADDVAHVAVLVRECDLVVGPLVLPGRGPCLHCLDLARRDRDPDWPRVLAQVLARRDSSPVAAVPALGQVAAGVAVLLGCAALDGHGPGVTGLTATVSLPLAAVVWRRWDTHPQCGCSRVEHPDRSPPGGAVTIVG